VTRERKTRPDSPSERDEAVRRLILDTGFDRFRRFGTRRITMDELARELRLSKKTIYRHFPTKEALVRACMDRIAGTIQQEILTTLGGDQKAAEKLRRIQASFAKLGPLITSEFVTDLKLEFPHLWEEIDRRRRYIIEHMADLIIQAREDGEIWQTIHPRVAVRMHFAFLQHVMHPDAFALGEFTPAEAVETMLTLLHKGMYVGSPSAPGGGVPEKPSRSGKRDGARRRAQSEKKS